MPHFMPNDMHCDLGNEAYVRYKAFLKNAESWSRDQIDSYQIEKFDNLVRTAVTKTKGYAKLYAEYGVADIRIKDFADIRKLPFVTKKELQKNVRDYSIFADDADYVTTGGSTGVPFGFYRSREAFAKELASKAYQYHRVGWQEGDRQVVFRGTPIETKEKYEYFPQFNELRMSSYHLTDEVIEYYLELIEDYKPHWIRCYPSSAQLLAQFLVDTGRRIQGLKGILCASENLYSKQSDLFRKVFSGSIFCHYGHFEQAVLAGFCETGTNYHVLPTYGHAELIGATESPVKTDGKIGEIVGTSFVMDATLFIRYKTQDFAVYQGEQCPSCGRPYTCWSRVEGRLQDWVVSSDGRPVSMTAFNMHDDIFDALIQYQFEQDEKGSLRFKMVPKYQLSDSDIRSIVRGVKKKLGHGFEVSPHVVSEIHVTSRGKHRFLLQRLPLNFGDQGIHCLFEGG